MNNPDEDCQILQWLSPLEPQQRHQSVRTQRLDGVGNWFLETNEFQKWRSEGDICTQPVLFCYGNPGVGKTFLSSLVIDSLCDQADEKDVAVVGLYCDFRTQWEQSATNMLGAILKQLVRRGEIPNYVREAFRKAKKEFGGRGLRLPDVVGMLKRAIALIPQVIICIDALDESHPKHLLDLLVSLRDIIRESPSARIFLTGRPHIRNEIKEHLSEAIMRRVSPAEGDVKRFLETKLDEDTAPEAMSTDLRECIMREIADRISEIFLLVSLNIEAILGEITIHKRRKKLHEMSKGNGLGDAYTATLERIKAQNGSRSRIGMDVLMWVSHSERPLSVDELCHALGVEIGSTDPNIQNIPTIRALLACSLGLVVVEGASSTVRLVHSTLQEYLTSDPTLFGSPHAMMGEACLTYLNFQCPEGISPTPSWAPVTAPFTEYASCYWGIHARRGFTKTVKELGLRLLDVYENHISSRLLLSHESDLGRFHCEDGGTFRGFTGLHCAAYFGIEEIADALLGNKEWDLNATDSGGNTALAWASGNGHSGVVAILLKQKFVDPHKADKNGRTPFLWAQENKHEDVVKMLQEHNDVKPVTSDMTTLGPKLSRPQAISGPCRKHPHVWIFKLLLKQAKAGPSVSATSSESFVVLFVVSGNIECQWKHRMLVET